jgi:poly(A) polymerase
MRVSGDWIGADHVQAVLAALTAGGHQALIVGGCVRNALLNRPVADVDIATDAVPDRVTALARAAGLKPVPTGVEHGTVTVVAGGVGHEVTTFRRDVETFGRHAVVAFSTRVEDDAARRDFTMNALYARADGTVIDPLGEGLADLAARRVRFVGEAEDRIREDYLRILRFFRFTAWYGDPAEGPEAGALAAIAAHVEGLDSLSRERVGHEVLRLLAAPDPAPAVAAMRATGALLRVLPGAEDRALAPLVHLEALVAPDPLRRLAALGGQDVAAALKLSRAQARRLDLLRDATGSAAGLAEIAYRHDAGVAQDVALLRGAVTGAGLPDGWEGEVATGATARFPVRAADLMPALTGPALGARLAELEARWIASGFALSREQLLA